MSGQDPIEFTCLQVGFQKDNPVTEKAKEIHRLMRQKMSAMSCYKEVILFYDDSHSILQ